MKIALFALLFGVCAALHLTPELVQDNIQGRVADKVFLQKQRDLLRLLRHVHQPNTYLDQVEIAKTFDIESNIALFEKPIVVQEFIQLYRYGMLPQKEIFSIMNDVHRRQVIAVFHLMYYAKTYDTFYRVACWCREHINQGMFVYALTVAVLHRPDCRGLILPPAYEIYPYYFINHETIKKAQELKMQDFAIFKPEVYQRLLKDPKIMGKLPFTQDYEHMTPVYGKLPISQDYEHMTPIYGNLRTDDVLIQNQKPWMYQKPTSSIWSKKPWMMVDDVQRPYVTKDVPMMNEYQKSMYGQVPTYMDKTYYGKTMDKTSYLPKYMTHDDILVKNPLLYKNMLNTVQQNFVPEVYQTVEDGIPTVIIPTNYSGWYLNLDEEQQKLSYFMEDIGLNSYYYYFHMDYPFWMLGTETGLNKDRRGELYFYTLHQLINRYYLERLSNGLGEMGMLDITNPVPYVCTLVYENGLPFPMRPSKTDLVYDDYTKYVYERINILEKRIIDAIDLGYVIDVTGNKVPIYTQEGINILGNIIQGNADSVNRRYYGHLLKWVKILLGYAGKPLDNYKVQPSTLEIFATAMRDPMFYRIYRRIVHYFLNYKKNLPTYKYTDLLYQGVKVNSVDIDELITYFDYFNVELNNALYNDFTVTDTDVPKVLVKARQMRLNHKPFTYRINVSSDKTTKAVVRVFLGPKYNEKGQLIKFEENRVNFVELDKFLYDLKTGENMIVRNSRNMHHIVKDRTSYYTLYRKVMGALQGTEEFILDNSEAHCGFPDRLLLPKGTVGGMEFQLFVVVTPFQGTTGVNSMVMDQDLMYTCGIGSGMRFIDNLPLGYPLDRDIDVTQFFVPNMYFQDVVIRHIDETTMSYPPTMMLRNY
ncbi:hexamerin-like [Chrysoperla carnea]|uniref:hexamerin-like n=1 Tax=Chrysoperla carnea TaxID=189513 RepID=UPI001D069D2D|nr:hexamerin-like [Chrysoperla carnea]